MKSKKVICGSLVFIFAAGFAIASTLAPQQVHVKAFINAQDEANFNVTCFPVTAECNDALLGILCTVQIFTTKTSTNKIANGYESVCIEQLRGHGVAVQEQIYDLAE